MKRLFWIAGLVSTSLLAQNRFGNNQPTSVIKSNVVGVFVGQYQLAYEHMVSDHLSLQLSLGFLDGSESGSSLINSKEYSYDINSSGIIAIPEIRYYLGERGPEGWYLAGLIRYRNKVKDLTDNNSNGTTGIDQDLSREKEIEAFGGGIVLGYQLISNGGFAFDVFGGWTTKKRTTTYTYDNNSLNATNPSTEYESIGEELFSEKYINFKDEDSNGGTLRFGFNLGYAF